MIDTILNILNIGSNGFISIDVEVTLQIISFKSRQKSCSTVNIISEIANSMSSTGSIGCWILECLIIYNTSNKECSVISLVKCTSCGSTSISYILNKNLLTNLQIVRNISNNSYCSRVMATGADESGVSVKRIIILTNRGESKVSVRSYSSGARFLKNKSFLRILGVVKFFRNNNTNLINFLVNRSFIRDSLNKRYLRIVS